jgi:hypothetical protein
MVGVAKVMPPDKYDFTPSSLGVPNFKFNGIRTFAEQVKHVAQQNYDFFSKVGRMKPDVDVDAIAKLKTKDEIVAALAASFAYAHKAVGTLTAENDSEVVPAPNWRRAPQRRLMGSRTATIITANLWSISG